MLCKYVVVIMYRRTVRCEEVVWIHCKREGLREYYKVIHIRLVSSELEISMEDEKGK